MKVLIIGSRVPYPLHDGGAIATFNLLKGLSEIGIEVDFISLNTSKHFADEATINKQFGFLNSIKVRYIDTSIKPVAAFLNLFTKKSYNIERFTDIDFTKDIEDLCIKNTYDFVHFEGLFVAQYVELVNISVPKILRQHNIEFKIWESLAKNSKGILKKWYINLLSRRLKKFEKSITSKFDAVVSITEDDRKDTIDLLKYTGKTMTIPAGIEIRDLKKIETYNSNIYHIGSMEWMPNQDAMKWFHDEIWPLIESRQDKVHFYMGGKQMPEYFKSFNAENFHVLAEVKDLSEFTRDKSILIVPLRSGSGIRIKTIEAMLSGKAVVTTSFGAIGLPIEGKKHCLIADDPQEFADAVISLIEDPEIKLQIANEGRRFAEKNFGNQSVSERWKNFYLSLKT